MESSPSTHLRKVKSTLTPNHFRLIAEQNEKEKLLFSLNEAMEKLEGEEHTAKVFQDRTSKAKQEIDDLTKSTEEMRETISKLEGT